MEHLDDDATLSRAVTVWIGHSSIGAPKRFDDRVAQQFGEDEPARLLPRLRGLLGTFYMTDAHHTAPDLATMCDVAAADFRAKHLEVSEEAVRALANLYGYDMK